MNLNDNLHEHPVANDLMIKNLHFLSCTDSLQDAINVMHQKEISSILIENKNEGHYFIIEYKDIIKLLYKSQVNIKFIPHKIPLESIMQGPIEVLDEKTPLDKIIRYLISHSYKRVIVGKDKIPTGIISTTDVLY